MDYIRAFAVLEDNRAHEEINPRWNDYQSCIRGVNELVLECGGRVQWTLFGDAQNVVPTLQERERVVDIISEEYQRSRTSVIAFEMWNEYWQNGGNDVSQMRRLAQRLQQKTSAKLPLALSCPFGQTEEAMKADAIRLYGGSVATCITQHYDRAPNPGDGWRWVRQCWETQFYEGVPEGRENNEPTGIEKMEGDNNPCDSNPHRQVAAVITSWMTGHWGHVLHSRPAGVRGIVEWKDTENIGRILGGVKAVKKLLPADLPRWSPQNALWPGHPYGDISIWLDGPSEGVVRGFAATQDDNHVYLPIGIRGQSCQTADTRIRHDQHDILTGEKVASRNLTGGERFCVRDTPVALIIGKAV